VQHQRRGRHEKSVGERHSPHPTKHDSKLEEVRADVDGLRRTAELDLVATCTPEDNGLTKTVRDRGGEAVRLSFWLGFDLAK